MRWTYRSSIASVAAAAFALLALPDGLAQQTQGPPVRPEDSLYEMILPQDPGQRAKLEAAITAAINADFRPTDHRVRDEGREVRAILAAARAKPGDRVLDVGSGGGYLALLLSAIVGERGHVDVHNTPGWIAQFPGMDPEALRARLARPNLGYVVAAWNDLPGGTDLYDEIMLGQVYHDAVLEGADIGALNARLFDLLKPGGRLVIEDHEADPRMPLGRQVGLHRIAVNQVMDGMIAAGFRLAGSFAVVSSVDDLNRNVFTPGIRGRTERFIVVFEKPGAPA
jgi:predicted methyltransferase